MATVKNEVFIGLLHENFYLVGKELTFGGGRNCSRCRVNEQIFREWGDSPYPPVGKTLLKNFGQIAQWLRACAW